MAATLSETRDGVLIVRFVDPELAEEGRIREIGGELVKLSNRPDVKQMLLNFAGVAFMSSAMLGQLAILSKRCLAHRVGLKMCHVVDTIREVLRIVRLDTLAEILDDEKEALKVFRRERRHKSEDSDSDADSDADTYRAAAAKGDAQAQFQLARCYEDGHGVEQDFAEARKWYEKSARQGSASGQFALATCYAYGMQVAQDYDEALKWYRKAADQGHPDAEYAMGMNYTYGVGVKADLAQAEKWYRKAAAQGHAKAREALQQLQAERKK